MCVILLQWYEYRYSRTNRPARQNRHRATQTVLSGSFYLEFDRQFIQFDDIILLSLSTQAVNSGLPADQQTVVEDPKTAPLLAVKDREDDRSGAINEKPADSPTVSEPATTTMTSTTSKDS